MAQFNSSIATNSKGFTENPGNVSTDRKRGISLLVFEGIQQIQKLLMLEAKEPLIMKTWRILL
jgi:hypothetical protein